MPRKPAWNGCVFMNVVRSLLALVKQELDRLTARIDDLRVAVGHSRMAKYSHQNASGHLSLLPTAIGTIWAAFSLVTSASSSGTVAGGLLMPALANRSLRYQKPTVCRS